MRGKKPMKKEPNCHCMHPYQYLLITQPSSAYVMVGIELEASNFLLSPASGQVVYHSDWSANSSSLAGDYGGTDSQEAYDVTGI